MVTDCYALPGLRENIAYNRCVHEPCVLVHITTLNLGVAIQMEDERVCALGLNYLTPIAACNDVAAVRPRRVERMV